MYKLDHKYNQHSASIYAIEYSPKLDLLFTGGGDRVVATWDLKKQVNTPLSIKTDSAILNLKFLNNHQHLFIGLFNGNFHIIDIDTKKEIKFFPYHKSGIFSSEYVEKENILFVGSGDGTISIWNTESFELIQNYKVSEGKIRAVKQFNDAIYFGTSEGDVIEIKFSDLTTANKLATLPHPIYCINIHEEKKVLLLGDKNAHITAFDPITATTTLSIPGHNWPIYAIEWMSDNVFATCSRDKIVKIWDAEKLEVIERLSFPQHKGHLNSINNLKYLPKEELLVSVGDDKQICVWSKL